MTERVLPPGMTSARSSCSRRDSGLRSTYRLLGRGDELREVGRDLLAHGAAMYTCT